MRYKFIIYIIAKIILRYNRFLAGNPAWLLKLNSPKFLRNRGVSIFQFLVWYFTAHEHWQREWNKKTLHFS